MTLPACARSWWVFATNPSARPSKNRLRRVLYILFIHKPRNRRLKVPLNSPWLVGWWLWYPTTYKYFVFLHLSSCGSLYSATRYWASPLSFSATDRTRCLSREIGSYSVAYSSLRKNWLVSAASINLLVVVGNARLKLLLHFLEKIQPTN